MGNERAACAGDESGPEPEPPAVASDLEEGAPRCVPPLGADGGPAPGTVAVPGASVGDPPTLGVNDVPGMGVGDTPTVGPGSGEAVGVALGVPAAREAAIPDGAEEAVPPLSTPVFLRAVASSNEPRNSLSKRATFSCRVSEGAGSEPGNWPSDPD